MVSDGWMMMKRAARGWISIGILGLLAQAGRAQDPAPPKLEFRISSEGWGGASPPDIEAVLRSAAGTLLSRTPGLTLPVLDVSRSMKDPITLYQRGPAGEIRIKLNVEGFLWSRFAFQFSHELGHVLCGAEEYPNPNMWFEETLCETASLYALSRMAETWKTRPPYPNWTDYAPSLKKYRDERVEKEGDKIPEGTSFQDWFSGLEPKLRTDPHRRSTNLTLAVALLPLFEEAPEHWNALRTLNKVRGDATRSFSRYLGDWSRSAPEHHRGFIAKIAARLGVTLDR
jgi:hypothetical protein